MLGRRHVPQAHDHDHDVEGEIDPDQDDGDADRLQEALQEHRASRATRMSVISICWLCSVLVRLGVLDQVGGGVGRRQGDGDQEVGGGEAQQGQDEQLALPDDSSRSSIAIEPSPRGLSSATRR